VKRHSPVFLLLDPNSRLNNSPLPTTEPLNTPPIGSSRPWWIFLAVATLAAALLRTAAPSGLAVEHFDEGVYASNTWCPDLADTYPDRHLYAPPGLPRLIQETHLWLGPSDLSSIAPSLLAGILLIPLLGLMTRDWFSEPAARAAVLLAVTSDPHILFSRTALTDVPWITWLVLAIWLTHKALISGRLGTLALAGLAVAAGWWTKYSGWLPLAIAATGVLATRFSGQVKKANHSPASPALTTWIKRLALISAVTALAITPLFVMLKDTGGYAAVATNHARYLVGLSGWLDSARAHAEHLWLFESPLTAFGVALACCFAAKHPGRFTWNAIRRRLALATLLAGLTAAVSFPTLVLIAAAQTLRDGWAHLRQHQHQQQENTHHTLAWAMLAAWWVAMSVTTPLYHPYPRLALPWLVAGWLIVAQQIARLIYHEPAPDQPPRIGRRLAVAAAIGTALLLAAIPIRFASRGIPAMEPRTAIAHLADQVVATVSEHVPKGHSVIRVWGEPALFFQLSNRSPRRLLIQPAGGLEVVRPGEPPPDLPVFLVIGPHATDGQNPKPDAMIDYQPLRIFEAKPGLQVRRNQPPARRDGPMTFHLYRWKPPARVSRETPQTARRSSTRTTR
jgi:hypothetical protein